MAWIELHQTLPKNKKLLKLKNFLKIKTPQAVGHLCLLWLWALDNAPDGDISALTPDELAEIAEWTGRNREAFLKALVSSGFVDSDMRLHDWGDYAGRLADKRRANAERMRSARAARSSDVSRTCRARAEHVQGLPYPTVPYRTVPEILSGGGGDTRTRAHEEVEGYLRERGLDPTAYFGMTEEELLSVRALTAEAFSAFAARTPTRMDEVRTFIALRETSRDMLLYAFEAANNAGKPGEWPYISGVIEKTKRRKIGTISEAEGFDFERKDKDGDRL